MAHSAPACFGSVGRGAVLGWDSAKGYQAFFPAGFSADAQCALRQLILQTRLLYDLPGVQQSNKVNPLYLLHGLRGAAI
jgi:hypothetical protein